MIYIVYAAAWISTAAGVVKAIEYTGSVWPLAAFMLPMLATMIMPLPPGYHEKDDDFSGIIDGPEEEDKGDWEEPDL